MNKEPSYIVGQRWLNYLDSDLGLGVIIGINHRHLQVSFPGVQAERIYAVDKAPLCRILYGLGDEIKTTDDITLTVTRVTDEEGVLVYKGVDEKECEHDVLESALSPLVKYTTPLDRLFRGHIDRDRQYKLKIETLKLSARVKESKSRGLIGARTEHIPHQVYIASEVAKRFSPRVLLADEVGLGKTIEAGLILHHQLITKRAHRIIIIVPETLIHQWLVEMMRRFNLSFSLFNEARYHAVDHDNPFESEQLIITSIDFLASENEVRHNAQCAEWDLVVVDEAHHLHWSEEKPSTEYQCIEAFASKAKGLLLLTATPEQLGIESHFARLRLLDKARFNSLSAFKKEEERFEEVNRLAEKLILYKENEQTDLMSEALKDNLSALMGQSVSNSIGETLSMLLDQHGTGRMLFRNTRTTISGFPKRVLHHYPLDKPSLYDGLSYEGENADFYPETRVLEKQWLKEDPRVSWLIETIRRLRPNKVLVITSSKSTAIALKNHLRMNTNIQTSAFHEGLSIIERDRAAAYFAQLESGAECLICSEIGSEGRNFQFSHELILFDLPLSPDLLEQRIGRLDRIGQAHDINIHVPIIKNTPIEALFYWYHEGLQSFQKSCSFGFSIYEAFEEELLSILRSDSYDKTVLDTLLKKTRNHADLMQQKAIMGRDRLLELSSCNNEKSVEIIEAIEAEEDPSALKAYMAKVFNAYGLSHEVHSEHTEILMPTDHMKTDYFPGLKEDGNTITYSREKALVREDIEFLSVEHPMVREAMEMILNEDGGQAVLLSMSLKNLPQGTLLLEAFYSVHVIAPLALDLDRFLSSTPIRVLTTLEGKNIDAVISHEKLSDLCQKIKRQNIYPIISKIRQDIESMAISAEQHADNVLPDIKNKASEKLNQELGYELERLSALQKVNPAIRQEELDFIKNQIKVIEKAIFESSLRLIGVRVVINQ